jgi:hypothetical protein
MKYLLVPQVLQVAQQYMQFLLFDTGRSSPFIFLCTHGIK